MIGNGQHQDQKGRMKSGLDFEKLTQNSSDKHKADMSSQNFHGGGGWDRFWRATKEHFMSINFRLAFFDFCEWNIC